MHYGDEKVLNSFLENSIPDNLREFVFNYNSGVLACWDIYLESLCLAAYSTTHCFHPCNLKINKTELETLLSAAKHVEKIVFGWCDIKINSDWDFSSITTVILN